MVNTLIPKFTEHLSSSVTIVGIVASAFAVTSILSRPLVGIVGTILRDRLILCISAAILMIAYGLFGFAKSVPAIAIGRLIQGAGMAFVGPICLTIASNSLPRDRIASGIAVFSIGQAAANAFGPSIGLWILSKIGYSAAFFTSSTIMLMALIISLTIPRGSDKKRISCKVSIESFIEKKALTPAIIFFFLGGAYSCIVSYIVLYGESRGIQNCGVFFSAYAVFVIISRFFSGRIGDKYGVFYVIVLGMICFFISFHVISVSSDIGMFIFAGAFSALGYGICQPSVQALCMMRVPEQRRNTAGNTCYLGVDVGYLAMPTVAGGIINYAQSGGKDLVESYIFMYRAISLAIVCALVIYIFSEKKSIQHERLRR